jgi:aspartokinase
MMPSKYLISLFLVSALAIVAYEWMPIQSRSIQNAQTVVKVESHNLLQGWQYSDEVNATRVDKCWGFSKKVVKKSDTNVKKVVVKKPLSVTVNDRTNQFCINNSCYRVLGIHTKDTQLAVSLYNPKHKPKLQSYHLHDLFEHNISLQMITQKSITLFNAEANASYHLQLFEVDVNKYKPKVPTL